MKHAMHYLVALAFALLTACAALQPKSFDQSLALGYTTQTAILQTTTGLLQRKQITKDDAQRVLAISDQASAALDAAKAAKGSGDLTTAQAQLTLATQVLDQLSQYLATKGK